MGRYSEPLADAFAEAVGLARGDRALDVGCGPGALTARLVDRLGVRAVSAVDPSAPFVEAVRSRFPGLDARVATAERLPFEDGAFDTTLAQLVVHFMSDPDGGLREMRRVTRPGGTVGACVWDDDGERSPLTPFYRAAVELQPAAAHEPVRAGTRAGHLAELFRAAGLHDVQDRELTVRVRYDSVDQWWEPYTLGVGPPGDLVAGLDA